MKRTELKRGTKGLKRGGRLKAKPKGRTRDVSDYLKRNPRCELTPLLDDLNPPGWEGHKDAWKGHPEAEMVDPHHVHGRKCGDADWNLIAASRVAHEFVQSTRVGRLVCLIVKHAKGDLCRDTCRLRIGRDPLGLIANDLENGIFTGRCERAARRLCEHYGI